MDYQQHSAERGILDWSCIVPEVPTTVVGGVVHEAISAEGPSLTRVTNLQNQPRDFSFFNIFRKYVFKSGYPLNFAMLLAFLHLLSPIFSERIVGVPLSLPNRKLNKACIFEW